MTNYTDTPLSITCAYDSSSNLWQCMTDAVSGQLADSVRLMMSCCLLAPVALNIAEPVSRPRELCIAAAALSPPQGASPRLLDVFIASFRKGAQGRSACTTCVFNPTKLPKLNRAHCNGSHRSLIQSSAQWCDALLPAPMVLSYRT